MQASAVEGVARFRADYCALYGEEPPDSLWAVEVGTETGRMGRRIAADAEELCMSHPEAGGSIRA
jgi:hypothetical protein